MSGHSPANKAGDDGGQDQPGDEGGDDRPPMDDGNQCEDQRHTDDGQPGRVDVAQSTDQHREIRHD